MRKFISLPFQIMLPLMALLIMASMLVTFLWVEKDNKDYLIQQQGLRQQDQKQFQLIRDMLRSRMESWFESFIHFQDHNADDPADIASNYKREFDYMQLNWHINNLWLFAKNNHLIFSSSTITPTSIERDVAQVFKEQASVSYIRCTDLCEQQISMPILTKSGDMVVLSFSSSLLEALAALHRTTSAQLAILSAKNTSLQQVLKEDFTLRDMIINNPISDANYQAMRELLNQLPQHLKLKKVLHSGYRFENANGSYLLNLLHVEPELNKGTFLFVVHDISDVSKAHKQYQSRIIVIAITVVILACMALFLITTQFRRRLVLLAEQFPLIARKKYHEFKQHQFSQNKYFVDEIEQLQDSANLLAEQLESADYTIEQNTRELENIAMNDWLTGLPNRNMLGFQLKRLLATVQNDSKQVTVMFLDFDQFREINDTHGHKVGDTFLVNAAQRIQGCLKESDMLFRFWGDEFVIVRAEDINSDNASILANKIISAFKAPIAVNEMLFYISSSIGITSTVEDSIVVDDLIRQADLAMYASKDDGGGKYSIFNEKMQSRVLRKVELESEVREALERDEFSFALQPQIEIATGKLIGFEALIRWIHPVKGFIAPDEFIPLIENSGHMPHIGYWGIKKAFDILQTLDDMDVTGLTIAINLSASQFLDPGLIPFLKEQLDLSNRDPSQLELELTERTLVADIEHTLEIMNELKKMGFIISIDDFGTGYSSLAYLNKMPVDTIKIDRSFVSAMHNNSADMQIVSSIIAMVKKLGVGVVAEGIESLVQLRMLKNLECGVGQGYFISRPIMEADLYKRLPEKLVSSVWDELDNLDSLE